MKFYKLTLFKSQTDNRPKANVLVNMELVQCIESHGDGSRIQFRLGEPSLYVYESKENILKLVEQDNV